MRDIIWECLGKTETEAAELMESYGLITRTTCQDGEHLPVTMDSNSNRVNLTIVHGVVTDVIRR